MRPVLPRCPTCTLELASRDGHLECHAGHRYTLTTLLVATNLGALHALWLAIRMLDDAAAGLEYAARLEPAPIPSGEGHRQEAHRCREAAGRLRTIASQVEEHLDRLPSAPVSVRLEDELARRRRRL